MVARIIDVRKYHRAGRTHVEVAIEVTRIVAGHVITDVVPELDFDQSILESDEMFFRTIKKRLSEMYPTSDPKKYIGMEIILDGD